MLDFLTLEQKKWLVKNQATITSQVTAGAISVAATIATGVCTVIFNNHSYELKRIVRDNQKEDFLVFEDIDFFTELRDSVRPNFKELEAEELARLFDEEDSEKKTKKKKDKKKKKNKENGGGVLI